MQSVIHFLLIKKEKNDNHVYFREKSDFLFEKNIKKPDILEEYMSGIKIL